MIKSNEQLARRIIYYFLKANPSKKPIDYLKDNYELYYARTFYWGYTDEGFDFWQAIYEIKFKRSEKRVREFLKKYFFNKEYHPNIINLNYVED